MNLVLASSSPYRKNLLQRFGLEFACIAPGIDERPLETETPAATAARLAEAKARTVASQLSDALVIGSDQLAVMDGRVLGKPGTRDANIAQLEAASGRWIQFLTGVCLLNASSDACQVEVVEYAVEFRRLNRYEIECYVDREKPFDCAGGFKAEGLGVSLFRRMRGDDPTALIGLPLISLRNMLDKEGVQVPSPAPDGDRTGRF